MLGPSRGILSGLPFNRKILLIVLVLSLAFFCSSISTTKFTLAGSTSPDFTITATGPVRFTSGSTTTSNVIVSPENEFRSEVALTAIVSPSTTLSVSLSPSTLVYGSGISTATYNSSTPGNYSVIITGTSGLLSRTTSVAVTVMAVNTPDFTVSASSSSLNAQPFISGSTIITITPSNGFTRAVTLSASVSPSGPTVTMSSSNISGGSGALTLTISVSGDIEAGNYLVTVIATSANLSHSKNITVSVTGTQDALVTVSASSLSFNTGASGTAIITVTPKNGFIGEIRLALTAPTGISCNLSSTSIQSSGTSTLTCNSSTAGDYAVTITVTGGDNPHTRTVSVHVAAVSPTAPAPSTILGLDSTEFYGIIAGIIVVVAGTVLVLGRRRSAP